ncbi:hypothetical protein ACHAW5_002334 [Stephanodiscus triporus]|uniref:Uncharacterized protein n=1 Tax=Stephanodiscus triporus TaxID=2934178 RepID=A0ABD3N3R9_9STRA
MPKLKAPRSRRSSRTSASRSRPAYRIIERNRASLIERGVEDVVEPPRKGRKIVICGDTADCRAREGLAQDADVLIHEATNTFLPGVDKDGNMKLTGEFAKRINAKKLVLTHFSARYKGDQSIESMTIMTRIERQAMKASGLPEDSVAAAWDFMVLPVSR